jgi:hypothetical protein
MAGNNGTHFITLDLKAMDLYSYDVASDGVIGKEASKISTSLYGSECDGIPTTGPFSGTSMKRVL